MTFLRRKTSEISDRSSVFARWARLRLRRRCRSGGESRRLTRDANSLFEGFVAGSEDCLLVEFELFEEAEIGADVVVVVVVVGVACAVGGFGGCSTTSRSGERFWSIEVAGGEIAGVVAMVWWVCLLGKTLSNRFVISLGGITSGTAVTVAVLPGVEEIELDRDVFVFIPSSTTSIHIFRIFSVSVPVKTIIKINLLEYKTYQWLVFSPDTQWWSSSTCSLMSQLIEPRRLPVVARIPVGDWRDRQKRLAFPAKVKTRVAGWSVRSHRPAQWHSQATARRIWSLLAYWPTHSTPYDYSS